jgi:hypothetical protein
MTSAFVAAALASSLLSFDTRAAAATDASDWNRPAEPFRVVGPIHFVGTSELGAFLVTTPGSENPFVDPEGYRAHVAEKKRTFNETLARQRAERPSAP